MELVLNAPFHLDSLGWPVLDVTRTVNHLGGHHDYMMTSWLYDDIMIIWWHHVKMRSWSYDDIMLRWHHDHMISYSEDFFYVCIPYSWATCDDHEKNDIMMRWHSLQSCCHPYWVPKSSFACGEQSMWNWQWLCEWLTCSNRADYWWKWLWIW